MKKSGFTLVELLGIIIILGLILAISVPAINSYIDKTEDNSLALLTENLKGAAQNYLADNMDQIPEVEGEETVITLEMLVQGNYIDANIENPKTHKKMSYTNTTITVSYEAGSYRYDVNIVDE